MSRKEPPRATPSQLQAAYKIVLLVPKDSVQQAIDQIRLLIPLPDDQVSNILYAVSNGGSLNTVHNPYKKSNQKSNQTNNSSHPLIIASKKRGRPKGTKNKKGHNAGGARNHASKLKSIPNQPTISFSKQATAVGGSGGGDDGGDDSSTDDDDNEDERNNSSKKKKAVDKEHERKEEQRRKNAIDGIVTYANSIPNGSIQLANYDNELDIDEPLDLTSDAEEEEDNEDTAPKSTKKKGRRTYKPTSGSSIHGYLKGICNKVKNGGTLGLQSLAEGLCWIPPINPIHRRLGKIAEPDSYHLSNVWVYVFAPTKQCWDLMPQKISCPCCKSDNTKFHRYEWRPAHDFDRIVQVIHRRLICNRCKASFSTIDPRVLASLPNDVVAQFPFVFPTKQGPGMSISMLLAFISLIPKGILYGAFTNMINQLQKVKYAMTHESYLNAILRWQSNPPVVVSSEVPTPFGSFDDPAGYLGVSLTTSLLQQGLRHFMSNIEGYMQAAHQLYVNDAVSADDSHKLCKKVCVKVGNKVVKPFGAVYSILSSDGIPNVSRMKFTKKPDELNEVMQQWAESRKNAGQPLLRKVERDNAAAETSLMRCVFPELTADVQPHIEEGPGESYEISDEEFTYAYTQEGVRRIALTLVEDVRKIKQRNGGTVRVAIDTEFDADGIHIISMKVEGDSPAVVMHLYGWGESFVDEMQSIMEMEGAIIVGVNISGDCKKINDRFGIRMKRMKELRMLAKVDDDTQPTGLADMALRYCNLKVDKTLQTTSYNVPPPLSSDMQRYCAIDAILPLLIDDALTEKLKSNGTYEESVKLPDDIPLNAEVVVKVSRSTVAKGKLTFIGHRGGDGGESTTWGNVFIGAGKALVDIHTILMPSAYLPIQRSDFTSKATFQHLASMPNKTIAVNTSQLWHRQDSIASVLSRQKQHTRHSINPVNITQPSDTTVETPAAAALASDDDDEEDDNSVTFADDYDTDRVKSRDKSDSWHELYNTPIKKDCPAAPWVFKLLHRATRSINVVEEERVIAVLSSKNILDHEDHFFFHKHWWYRRVRMPFKNGEEASVGILKILTYIKATDGFSEYVTPELEKHLTKWAERCRSGRYEQLPGMDMYIPDGTDSNGLDLWLRTTGTKGENYHQKLIVGTGPFGMGVESAHYYHVLLSYMYLVNASVRRGRQPDFGHYLLDIEDRIQSKILKIWGVTVFPGRVNVSEFQPTEFQPIGVGPLTFNPDYVKKSDTPSPALNGGLKFMAKKMKVEIPPLPLATKEEYGILKEFCTTHPQPSRDDVNNLCKHYLQLADGRTILPKHPTLINPGIKRWKINQSITLLGLRTEKGFTALLKDLRTEISLPLRSARPLSLGNGTGTSTATASTNTTTNATATSRIHIGPISTSGQTTTVPVANSNVKCSWWPVCKDDVIDCSGFERKSCRNYGTDGRFPPPSQEDINREHRIMSWNQLQKTKDCAYHPICTKKAWDCGGRTKRECTVFNGKDSTIQPPTDEELKEAKKQSKRVKQRLRRAAKTKIA